MEPNVQPDHVHLVVSIPPKYAVLEFRGYCVSTIGLDEETEYSVRVAYSGSLI